jgi:hypothetical protein
VWNAAGQLLAVLEHELPVYDAAFDPKGTRIAAAAGHRVFIWESHDSVDKLIEHAGRLGLEPLSANERSIFRLD